MCEAFIRLAGRVVRKMYPEIKSNPDYTSVINERHYRRIVRYIEEAKAAGVRVVDLAPGGEALASGDRRLVPMLVVEPDDRLAVMRDGYFRTRAPGKDHSSIADAIDYINRRPRPLALYYFGVMCQGARRGTAADPLGRCFGQHHDDARDGRGAALWRHRCFRLWRLSRRGGLSDFVASQKRIPTESF